MKSKFVWNEDDVAGIKIYGSDGKTPLSAGSLKSSDDIAQRYDMLEQPHMHPLNTLVQSLRNEKRGYVPDFDPLDGGVDARILFVLEKPGPMTDPSRSGKTGSGFISRDNDDPTARSIFTFMRDAGIDRRDTLIWNAIPWWNKTIKIAGQEWKDGLDRLAAVIALLPRLQSIVLVGKKAAKVQRLLEDQGRNVFVSAHPSPRTRAAYPALWEAIPTIWAEAGAGIGPVQDR